MHNSEFVLEEIQTYYLISARRPELGIINKKMTFLMLDFAVSADQEQLKKSEKRNKYQDLPRELFKKNYEI